MANEVAPEGAMYVCGACGKRSRDLYGEHSYDQGWDESCMLNAVLCAYKAERSWDYEAYAPATFEATYEPTE